MHPQRQAGAGGEVEHVALAEQRLGAHLVEDGARIDLARHLEGNARRDVGLDQAGDDIDARPLRGEDQVDAGGARLLRQARDQFLDLLADHHHQVGQFVDHHHDEGQRFEWLRAFPASSDSGLGSFSPAFSASWILALKPARLRTPSADISW